MKCNMYQIDPTMFPLLISHLYFLFLVGGRKFPAFLFPIKHQ